MQNFLQLRRKHDVEAGQSLHVDSDKYNKPIRNLPLYCFFGILAVIGCISWVQVSLNVHRPAYASRSLGSVTAKLARSDNSTLGHMLRDRPGSIDVDNIISFMDAYAMMKQRFSKNTEKIMPDEVETAFDYGFCNVDGTPVDIIAGQETGPVLEVHVGFAYYLHLVGCLGKVRAYEGMQPFFFFAKNFEVLPHDYYPNSSDLRWNFGDLPHANPFQMMWRYLTQEQKNNSYLVSRAPYYPLNGVLYPPYTKFFSTGSFRGLFSAVGGKHVNQWQYAEPVNSIAYPSNLSLVLDGLVANGFATVYTRFMRKDVPDVVNFQKLIEVGDEELIRSKYLGKVLLIQDLFDAIKPHLKTGEIESYNILQLMVYADIKLRVSTQGGNSVVSSLTDGNIFLLHIVGSEFLKSGLEYVYPRWNFHGGARFFVFDNVSALARNVRRYAQEEALLQAFPTT